MFRILKVVLVWIWRYVLSVPAGRNGVCRAAGLNSPCTVAGRYAWEKVMERYLWVLGVCCRNFG